MEEKEAIFKKHSGNVKEHRLSLRLPVDMGVELGITEGNEHVKGHLDNISDEGVSVTISRLTSDTEEKLLQGKLTLDVEFKIPMPDHAIEAQGRVVWIKTKGRDKSLGIHLENLDEDSKKKILHYILNRIVESQFKA